MIPAEVRAAAATLGHWCRREAERLRGANNPVVNKEVLLYELIGSVCALFLKVTTC